MPFQTYKQETQIDTNRSLQFYMNPAGNKPVSQSCAVDTSGSFGEQHVM